MENEKEVATMIKPISLKQANEYVEGKNGKMVLTDGR